MFGNHDYYAIIRKYVTLIGTMFSDIIIERDASDGSQSALITVPVTYGPKDKMIARIKQDPNIDKQTAISTLPLISFELKTMSYDGDRHLNTISKVSYKNDANNSRYQYNFVAYDFKFNVYIYIKNVEDGTKIMEQILPYFTPDWTMRLKLIPNMEEIKNVPVILDNVSYQDDYDGDFTKRRITIWTLELTVKGYLYGPTKVAPVIKFTNTSFYAASYNTTPQAVSSVLIQPGLLANGSSTSNSAASIPVNEIEATDDFGYCITKEDYIY